MMNLSVFGVMVSHSSGTLTSEKEFLLNISPTFLPVFTDSEDMND
jgi:hypothetical protein